MAYEFHYTPTGTGAISGTAVLEQTEDAINDLGNTAISGVQEALDKAQQAFTNSANAVDDAQTALNTANNAEGVAIQAQNDVSNLSGTVTNIGNRVTTAEGDIGNLQGRMTTAEGNIGNLQGRMTTAEGNIGNLQTAVSTAQATANSAQQTATTARQQSYVFRYSSTALVASSTNSNTLLDNTDNLKVGDKVIDSSGVLFSITAIDTQNSTFTIGTALVDLAQDSDVVHKSGNETVSGYKTFSSNVTLYNSSASVNPVALFFKNKKVVIGSTTDIGSQNIAFRDSADTNLSILKTSCESVGNTSLEISVFNKNSNNQTVSGGMLVSQTPANTYITPTTDNTVLFGSTNRRWSKIYGTEYYYGSNNVEFSTKFVTTDTAQTISGNKTFSSINGVEPSSLSLPSDRSARIDISSYITNLGNGDNNQYIVPANGYIWLHFTSINSALCYSQTSGGLTNYAQTFVRYQGDGQLYAFFPVRKNDYFIVQIYTSSTAVVQSAYFIPCQGNV